MKKGEGWWLWAMAANSMRSGNKKGNNGGCLSTIIGFILIAFIALIIIQEDFRASVIEFAVIVGIIAVIIAVVVGVKKQKNQEEHKEQEALYNDIEQCEKNNNEKNEK